MVEKLFTHHQVSGETCTKWTAALNGGWDWGNGTFGSPLFTDFEHATFERAASRAHAGFVHELSILQLSRIISVAHKCALLDFR